MSSSQKRSCNEDDEESLEINRKLMKVNSSIENEKLIPPEVVHIRRLNGKIIQDCDIYIGRACNMGGWHLAQSKWKNPYSVKQYGREQCLTFYKNYIKSNNNHLFDDLHELAGKRLGCWCKPNSCHGDILRELFIEKFL